MKRFSKHIDRRIRILPYDTNVTHDFETLLKQGFQRVLLIEWE